MTLSEGGLRIARRLRRHVEVGGWPAGGFAETGTGALAVTPGVYNGAAGLRLLFAEAAVVAPGTLWPDARDLRSGSGGTGLFSGDDGDVVAAWAEWRAGFAEESFAAVPPGGVVKQGDDLMDGLPGRWWAAACVGAQSADTAPWVPEIAGLAGLGHGRAGWVAAGAANWSEPVADIVDVLDAEADAVAGPAYAWCNGLAGLAVAAAMSWRRFGDEPGDLSGRARRWAAAAVDGAQTGEAQGGGLCHGRIGGIVSAAQVACVLEADDLLQRSYGALAAAAAASVASGWVGGSMDRSFMTGMAGVAWALLSVGRRPLASPLVPTAGAAYAS